MTWLSGRVITPHGVQRGAVKIEGGRIASVSSRPIRAKTCRDYGDAYIVPGFVDVHVHGIGPHGFSDADEILGAARWEVRFGTTGFLPSVASCDEERYIRFGREIRKAQLEKRPDAARILGAHFEGPFINPERKGGMNAAYLRPMDIRECARYADELGNVLRMMTLSPELDGSEEVIRFLSDHGVVVSIGHSDASPEQLHRAVKAGLRHVCHLYNTFKRHTPTRQGLWVTDLIAAILAEDSLTCEVICDMHHVSPENVKFTARILGPDRFVAITDAMTGAGLPEGEYTTSDGRRYSTEGGIARVVPEGTVVGSVLTMDRAFRNLVEVAGVDPAIAARFTATNPARVLGLAQETGSIEPGKRADLAVIGDDYRVIATFVGGEQAHGG